MTEKRKYPVNFCCFLFTYLHTPLRCWIPCQESLWMQYILNTGFVPLSLDKSPFRTRCKAPVPSANMIQLCKKLSKEGNIQNV